MPPTIVYVKVTPEEEHAALLELLRVFKRIRARRLAKAQRDSVVKEQFDNSLSQTKEVVTR